MGDLHGVPIPRWLETSGMPDLVGRAKELRSIEAAWEHVLEGRRQTVFIGGVPGAGKSRLAAEAAQAAHHQGALVLHGRCFAEQATPFQPFVEAFERFFAESQPEQLADIDKKTISTVQQFVDSKVEPAESATIATRSALFESVARFLMVLSRSQPAVLVVDDLHWGSAPTLEMLAHTARSAAEQLLILVTFRTTLPERSLALTRVVADLYRQPGVSRMDLEGLSVEEIAAYLAPHAGGDRATLMAAATVLRDLTGGNPFFVNEAWAAASERGGLPALAAGRLAIPATLSDAIQLRLTGLTAAQSVTLQLAALLGDDIETDVIVGASAEIDAFEAFDLAVGSGLMQLQEPAGYAFVHALGRQAIIDGIRPSERSALHGRLAAAIEERFGEVPGAAVKIAHHYEAAGSAGNRLKAVHYLEVAGNFAENRMAFEEAAQHFERSAGLEASKANRDRLLLHAAENHVKAGGFEAAQSVYEVVCSSSDPVRRAKAAIGFEDAGWRPGFLGHAAVEKLSAASSLLDPEEHPALSIQVRASLSRALAYCGRHGEAEIVGDEALAKARQFGDERLLAVALNFPLTDVRDASLESMDRVRESFELSRRVNDADLIAQSAFTMGTTAYVLGRPGDWAEATRGLAEVVGRSGQPLHRTAIAMLTAATLHMKGDFGAAERALDPLLEPARSLGSDDSDGLHAAALFMIRRETGLEDVRPLISGNPKNEPGTWPLGLLAVYTELGMVDAAAGVLEQLVAAGVLATASQKYHGSEAAFLSDAIALVGSQEDARRLYEILSPRSGTNLLTGHFVCAFGSADRYLGVLAGMCGEDPEPHFQMALEMDRRMGSVIHEAETLARYADFLNGRDTQRSQAMGTVAWRIADGASSVRIKRMVENLSGSRQGLLTSREVEVLRLIALGRSNRDIGQELFISANTAANHVRNILIKTGTSNRTQAARHAADTGLL